MSILNSVQLGPSNSSPQLKSPTQFPISTKNVRQNSNFSNLPAQFLFDSTQFRFNSSTISILLQVGNSKAIQPSSASQQSFGALQTNTKTFQTNQQPKIQVLIDKLRGVSAKGWIKEGKAIHGFAMKCSFNDGEKVILFNHIAHMYVQCLDFEGARQLFDEMPERNVFSWTVMIVGSNENGLFLDGIRYFCGMVESGVRPDKFAYSALVQSCTELGAVGLGEVVHGQIVKSGLFVHVVVGTSLVNMYAKCGEIEDSVKVFDCMEEHNEVSWNAMIAGFASNGLQLQAFDQFLDMKREGFVPNVTTFASVLKAIGKIGDVGKGREVHGYINELGIESNVRVGTAIIDMYSKCGCLDDARLVFDAHFSDCRLNMPWNAMISGYSQSGCSEEALKLFVRMCLDSVGTDLFTYASVFNAVADLKCLKFGREVHAVIVKFGYDVQVLTVNNAIAHAYSKCGCIEDAEKVFQRMEKRDVVTWTTMVSAYAMVSEEKALQLFLQMREENVRPNQLTFASVLAACASLCLLMCGRQIHGLLCKAGLHNHDCTESSLIDMYAKCGCIIEAENIFKKITAPDVVSWTAIISGYAQHGLAEQAIQLFRRMEESGIKANGVTLLCVLFACSHGGMLEEGLHYFKSMEETYGVVPDIEHYACVVDILGRLGCLDDAVEFINNMPFSPTDMIWQTLLAACRVHRNAELGEIAAKKILSVTPQFSATYVLLFNTYIERGSLEDARNLRNVMRDRGVKKDPGFSWISVKGTVHKFFAGDKQHPQKEAIYAQLDELKKHLKTMGYIPDLRYVLQDVE